MVHLHIAVCWHRCFPLIVIFSCCLPVDAIVWYHYTRYSSKVVVNRYTILQKHSILIFWLLNVFEISTAHLLLLPDPVFCWRLCRPGWQVPLYTAAWRTYWNHKNCPHCSYICWMFEFLLNALTICIVQICRQYTIIYNLTDFQLTRIITTPKFTKTQNKSHHGRQCKKVSLPQ